MYRLSCFFSTRELFLGSLVGGVLLLMPAFGASAPPIITEISPNPVMRSETPQVLRISGENFAPGSEVTFRTRSEGVQSVTNPARYISDNLLTVEASFVIPGITWGVRVMSPEGEESNVGVLGVAPAPAPVPAAQLRPPVAQFGAPVAVRPVPRARGQAALPTYFTGTYPAVGPAVTRVIPSTVVRPGRTQTLMIFGTNISPGATVTLRNVTRGTTRNAIPTNFITPSRVSIRASLTNLEDLWTAQVVNPDGTMSPQVPFEIVNESGTQPKVPLPPPVQQLYPEPF